MPDPMSVTQEQVTQADNDLLVKLTEWLITHDAYDEDLDSLHIEAFGAFAEPLLARHRLTHTEPQDASRPSDPPADVIEGMAWEMACVIAYRHNRQGGNHKPDDWMGDERREEARAAYRALRTQEARPEAVEAPFDKADCVKCGTNPHAIELCLDCQNKFFAALSEQPRTDVPVLTPEEEAELVERINSSANLQPRTDAGMREALKTARDYVSDVAGGALTITDAIKAMAKEDLARIDQALGEGR